ncbi:tetratricopeptide repeat protein [candidate division WOR-3 bacterium]|nr:tetratricopeptide repeat protein [candidate division WOR-3 bacterium]
MRGVLKTVFLFFLFVVLFPSCTEAKDLKMKDKMNEYENLWWQFKLKDARNLLEEILQEDSDYPDANRKMAFIEYYYYENFDKALRLIRKAINKEPEEKNNYPVLGDIYFANGKFVNAVEVYNKALEFDSTDSDLYYSIAKSYIKLNNKTEAKRFLEKAVRYNPYNLNANRILHLLYIEDEEYEKAYNIWKTDHLIVNGRKPIGNHGKWNVLYEATLKNRTPNFHYEMGKLYKELLLYDEAMFEFRKAVEMNPKDNEVNKELNKTEIFINFREELRDFWFSYYKKRIFDNFPPDSTDTTEEKEILERLSPIYYKMLVLFPEIAEPKKFNKDWFYKFNSEIEKLFRVNILYGHTNRIFDCHFGYIIGDTLEKVSQWGKEGGLRIVVLKNMVTNGFSAWYWNYQAQDGGWTSSGERAQANKVTIVMDPKYGAATHRWEIATNKERRNKIIEDSKETDAVLIDKPCLEVFYSSLLDYQLQFAAIDEAIGVAKTEFDSEDEITSSVINLLFDHYHTTSTFIHEGQHALDNLYFNFEQWELEYRAKLSEIVYGEMPFLSLSDLLSRDIGDESLSHGKANTKIFKDIVNHIHKDEEKHPAIDTCKNILMQLTKLNSKEIRDIARQIFENEYIDKK